MSKLKYKVGDIAGPFEIIQIDFEDQELPYRVEWHGRKKWLSGEATESLFDNYTKSQSLETKSELLEKKAESNRKTIAYWKDKFASRTEFFNQLSLENRTLKESNVELRESKESLTKQLTVMTENFELSEHASLDLYEELKTIKSHLDLRIKGIEALESDAKKNRIEIELLKADHASIWDEYNNLDQSRKHSTVLAWIGWIFFFIAIFGMIFLRN
jgi:small-conductance mechanosensitive channel